MNLLGACPVSCTTFRYRLFSSPRLSSTRVMMPPIGPMTFSRVMVFLPASRWKR